jgi:NADH-quinone oxidoreductase subunit A
MDPTTFVFFMIVFTLIGVIFLFIHLVMGSVIRPSVPDPEKLTIYECGEPTVGSAWVQFDLRYYVVALLFVIFDVEVAFFFPWATVFGKANQIANLPVEEKPSVEVVAQRRKLSQELMPTGVTMPAKIEMGLVRKNEKAEGGAEVVDITSDAASSWARIAFFDIVVFFGVLMVGFAYVWRRGDIDWVRAYGHHLEPPMEPERPLEKVKPHIPAAPAPPVAVH